MRTVKAAPSAASLIESMRDLGYSLETALADVIDNSITAKASQIDIFADTSSPDVTICVLDNGEGLSEEELFEAMRPGSQSPAAHREASDLGRFGLGLKTASFSQCRRLTFVSRKGGETSAAVWDLDRVRDTDDWLIEVPESYVDIPLIDRLGEQGSLVVWQKMDRLTERRDAKGPSADNSHVVQQVDAAREHLELVFHRFLAGEPGLKKTRISLNNRPLEPFDPFHASHPATKAGPVEKVQVAGEIVTVQTFTLPHHSNVDSAEWERYAGRGGYLRNQGFYVYRARRLIIHGTWFGLTRQAELTKLARVRIDMPNGLDEKWKIDVRKASAQPPKQVRARLREIIDPICATSKRVYTRRGTVLITSDQVPLWQRVQERGEIKYRLNPEHPVVAELAGQLPDDARAALLRVLELASAALPLDALLSDLSGEPDKVGNCDVSDQSLTHAVSTTAAHFREMGLDDEDIRDALRFAEPFRSNWDRAEEDPERHHRRGQRCLRATITWRTSSELSWRGTPVRPPRTSASWSAVSAPSPASRCRTRRRRSWRGSSKSGTASP